MNSPNQPTRQYHQNTCELSIEDKKSPFPAWMNFNKPNPLKFQLNLQDPDRPDQPPIGISGDRVKLDTLYHTVEEYVSELLVKAPLPQLESSHSEDSGIFGQPSGLVEGAAAGSMERPIDALKMTGDQPHLEADGPSRHLLYLGNMAADGQVMASLSTLQLFDLSSILAEATQPVSVAASAEDSSAALASVGTEIEPELISPPAPPAPVVAQKLETNVEEPRVVLPSVQEAVSSGSLESESSFFERNSTVGSNDSFKMPKPSLNLPELPDFSNSPLTSIWLWLGLGTLATGIVAFPFLSKSFNEGLASKPAVQSTPSASAESSDLAGIPTYQPSPVTPPSGQINSNSGSPAPSLGSTTSPSGSSVTITPAQGTGVVPGITGSLGSFTNSLNPGATNPRQNQATQPLGGSTPADRTSLANAQRNRSGDANISTKPVPPLQRPSDVVKRGNSRQSLPPAGTGGTLPDLTGMRELEAKTSPVDPVASASRNTRNARSSRSGVPTTPANPGANSSETDLVGQGQSLSGDNFDNSSSINTPVTVPATDNLPVLGNAPSNLLGDSPQVSSTRQYLQKRWRADPKFNESLQYNVRVGRNGKVVSVEGQSAASREYLNRTKFIGPGTPVADPSGSGQDQNIQVILRPDGSTEAFGNP